MEQYEDIIMFYGRMQNDHHYDYPEDGWWLCAFGHTMGEVYRKLGGLLAKQERHNIGAVRMCEIRCIHKRGSLVWGGEQLYVPLNGLYTPDELCSMDKNYTEGWIDHDDYDNFKLKVDASHTSLYNARNVLDTDEYKNGVIERKKKAKLKKLKDNEIAKNHLRRVQIKRLKELMEKYPEEVKKHQ